MTPGPPMPVHFDTSAAKRDLLAALLVVISGGCRSPLSPEPAHSTPAPVIGMGRGLAGIELDLPGGGAVMGPPLSTYFPPFPDREGVPSSATGVPSSKMNSHHAFPWEAPPPRRRNRPEGAPTSTEDERGAETAKGEPPWNVFGHLCSERERVRHNNKIGSSAGCLIPT